MSPQSRNVLFVQSRNVLLGRIECRCRACHSVVSGIRQDTAAGCRQGRLPLRRRVAWAAGRDAKTIRLEGMAGFTGAQAEFPRSSENRTFRLCHDRAYRAVRASFTGEYRGAGGEVSVRRLRPRQSGRRPGNGPDGETGLALPLAASGAAQIRVSNRIREKRRGPCGIISSENGRRHA